MKLALILATFCLSTVAHAADPKVGFIDKDRVIAESAIGKRLRADAISFGAEQQAQVDAATAAANHARGTKDEQAKLQGASAALNQANQAIKDHNEQLDAGLMKEIRAIAKKLADEKKLDFVDYAIHLYARNDLTDLVIARLDAETYGASEKLHAEKEAAEKKLAEKESAPPPQTKDAPKK
jgi:Skp family chaperone for outer membrane proteins